MQSLSRKVIQPVLIFPDGIAYILPTPPSSAMTEETTVKQPRQLKIHTQFLVAITRLARPMGWAVGDPIDLNESRAGKIVIENMADPETIAERAKVYAGELEEKERLYKAKKEKLAAEALTKKEQKAEEKAAKEAAAAAEAPAEVEAPVEEAPPEPEEVADAANASE